MHGLLISGATDNVDCSFMKDLCRNVSTMNLVARAPDSLQHNKQLRMLGDVALKTCFERFHPAWAHMQSHYEKANPPPPLR